MTWNTYTAQGQLKQLSAASPLAPMIPISDTVLGTTQASITVNLPSTYQHALIYVSGRSDVATAGNQVYIRLNGDSAANYDTETVIAAAATNTASESLAQTQAHAGWIPGSTTPAGSVGKTVIELLDYNDTTHHKMMTSRCALTEGTTSGLIFHSVHTTRWRSTAAATSFTLLPPSGNFTAGTRVTVYGMGVTNPNGIGVGAFTPPTYATTLPASPADGQQAILVDSTTSPTYQWLFRYNAGSSQTDKWEFIGGTPAIAKVDTSETTASAFPVNLTTTGPTITVARAGQYLVRVGCYSGTANGVQGSVAYMSYAVGAAAADSNDGTINTSSGTGIQTLQMAAFYRQKTATASMAFTAKYGASGGTVTFINRVIEVIPVRVS